MNVKEHKNLSLKLKNIIIDLFIVIGISIAFIFVVEVFLRLMLPQNLRGESITGETFSEPDEIIGLRYRPGSRWRFMHPEYTAEYAINEHGFRDTKPHPVPKPTGTIRVLLVGDSFTFGQGVNYHESWPAILEKRLHEAGYDHIDLVKAGIQGMDTRSEFILMQQLLEQYHYDVIVVGFLINDLYTNTLYRVESNEERLEVQSASDSWLKFTKKIFINNNREKTFHSLNIAKRMAISFDSVYCKLYLATPNRGGFLTVPLQPEQQRKLEITKSLFEKIADFSHSAGKKLIVFSIPQQFQVLCYDASQSLPGVDLTYYENYFSALSKKNHFTWITSLNEFIDAKDNELFYRLDGHLTPYGNQIAADIFIKKIVPIIDEMK